MKTKMKTKMKKLSDTAKENDTKVIIDCVDVELEDTANINIIKGNVSLSVTADISNNLEELDSSMNNKVNLLSQEVIKIIEGL